MGTHDSITETFESVLTRGRQLLSDARDEYAALEGDHAVPEQLVEAISTLERELEELDQTLEVTDEHLSLANTLIQRISLLVDVLAALRERQRVTIEADVHRLDVLVSGIASMAQEHDFDTEGGPPLEDVKQRYSMLHQLVDSGRYNKVTGNDRVSPSSLDASVRQVIAWFDAHASSQLRAETYLDFSETLLSDIHDVLSTLGQENDARTAYQADLRTVKGMISDAERLLEDAAHTGAGEQARVALEGCLMLHYAITRTHARHSVTAELAHIIRENNVETECDVSQSVASGDTESLLTALSETIATHVERSTSDRVGHLLKEHDGSVSRTTNATNFDISSIMNTLEQMYNDGHIADITVEFSE